MSEVKQPADRKTKAEPFVWKCEDGQEVTLTPFKRLPAYILEELDGASEIKATFALLKAATSEADYAVVRQQPLEDLEDMQAGWMKASGVDLPES